MLHKQSADKTAYHILVLESNKLREHVCHSISKHRAPKCSNLFVHYKIQTTQKVKILIQHCLKKYFVLFDLFSFFVSILTILIYKYVAKQKGIRKI